MKRRIFTAALLATAALAHAQVALGIEGVLR